MKQGRINSLQTLVLSFLITLLLTGRALAQGWPCPFWGPGAGGTGGAWGWLGGMFTIAFWILILIGIVRLLPMAGSSE